MAFRHTRPSQHHFGLRPIRYDLKLFRARKCLEFEGIEALSYARQSSTFLSALIRIVAFTILFLLLALWRSCNSLLAQRSFEPLKL